MLSEHLIYSSALAIFTGMLYLRFTGRDHSWIIILCAFIPDLDKIADTLLRLFGFTVLFQGDRIHHGTFHTIAMMVIFGVMAAYFLHPFGIKFVDSLFFSIIGFGAHLLEDALVYPSGYMYLWPLISHRTGLGVLPGILSEESYQADILGIANREVLLIGLFLLIIVLIIRTSADGPAWIRFYMPDGVYKKIFPMKIREASGSIH